MRIKTIVISIIIILLLTLLIQNRGIMYFQFLWATFTVSKLTMLLIMTIIGFILGYLVGRPKNIKRLGRDFIDPDLETKNPDTLSDEDKNYIN